MNQENYKPDYRNEFENDLNAYEAEHINNINEDAEAEQIRKDEFIKAYNEYQNEADSYRDDHDEEVDDDDDERLQDDDELAYIDHKLNEVD